MNLFQTQKNSSLKKITEIGTWKGKTFSQRALKAISSALSTIFRGFLPLITSSGAYQQLRSRSPLLRGFCSQLRAVKRDCRWLEELREWQKERRTREKRSLLTKARGGGREEEREWGGGGGESPTGEAIQTSARAKMEATTWIVLMRKEKELLDAFGHSVEKSATCQIREE